MPGDMPDDPSPARARLRQALRALALARALAGAEGMTPAGQGGSTPPAHRGPQGGSADRKGKIMRRPPPAGK